MVRNLSSKLLAGLICLLIVVLHSVAFGASITLQQGLDGYIGNVDAQLRHGGNTTWSGTEENFSTNETLYVAADQYDG